MLNRTSKEPAKGQSRPHRFTSKRILRVRDPGSVLRALTEEEEIANE